MNVIDFEDFKQQYIDDNLPKLYAGELDADMAQLAWNMNSDECAEFNYAAKRMLLEGISQPMEELLEKLAIEYLESEAKDEYRNMIASIENERGEDEAFYQMNR